MRDPSLLDHSIRAHLEAENAYAKAIMADTEELQARLFAEMKGRIKEDDASVPTPDGSFAYYTRYVTGGQHPLFSGCREKAETSACWWTATHLPSHTLISGLQGSLTAPITG
jgi:protease II